MASLIIAIVPAWLSLTDIKRNAIRSKQSCHKVKFASSHHSRIVIFSLNTFYNHYIAVFQIELCRPIKPT